MYSPFFFAAAYLVIVLLEIAIKTEPSGFRKNCTLVSDTSDPLNNGTHEVYMVDTAALRKGCKSDEQTQADTEPEHVSHALGVLRTGPVHGGPVPQHDLGQSRAWHTVTTKTKCLESLHTAPHRYQKGPEVEGN
ncbi:uncharacterized protein LOC142817783 [Rhipicephalus microplus]|uniref:uncharacterized protein LOC142817783 n=1 Tax=Rhipicephalus microplus TaxID=6941 RepID=UPI003F6AC87E